MRTTSSFYGSSDGSFSYTVTWSSDGHLVLGDASVRGVYASITWRLSGRISIAAREDEAERHVHRAVHQAIAARTRPPGARGVDEWSATAEGSCYLAELSRRMCAGEKGATASANLASHYQWFSKIMG